MSALNRREMAVLRALVALGEPGYGLTITAKMREAGEKLGDHDVYPVLRDLERRGFLESWEGEPLPERGGRPRRYYKLTARSADLFKDEEPGTS